MQKWDQILLNNVAYFFFNPSLTRCIFFVWEKQIISKKGVAVAQLQCMNSIKKIAYAFVYAFHLVSVLLQTSQRKRFQLGNPKKQPFAIWISWQASSSKYLEKSKRCDFVLYKTTVLWMWPEAGPCTAMGGAPRCWGWARGAGKKGCSFTLNEALWVTVERVLLNWWDNFPDLLCHMETQC